MPETVRGLAAGAPVRPVWRNELGGLTFAVGSPVDRYVKWAPAGCGIDLGREAARLRWADRYVLVPEPLDSGTDSDGNWLVTRAIAGASAVHPRWLADSATAAGALGTALRKLHDALPVPDCPFSWSAPDRAAAVFERTHRGNLDPGGGHAEHAALPLAEVLDRLADPPPVDRLVVCHGDPCAPNTLLDATGAAAGFVDLGSLGVADRWADLAVGSWSLDWNYGPGHQARYFEAYGVAPDADRIAFYRLLWDLAG